MILRTIGQGGMGAVYQARDLKDQSTCAVKEMSLSQVPEEERPQAIQNFKGEAQMLKNLGHVNLPTFSDYFAEGSRYFLVMEYIDGQTLEYLLEQNGKPFPEHRVLNWARQLCDVLEYLHGQKPQIIFRDMKPGNIMLTRNGRIKLIDFGIARFARSRSLKDKDTQVLGTPGFAPPEQYGKAQTDQRSDIYSLAITLFQLLTNTLSEKGFGLNDITSYPNISPAVGQALKKAASLAPEDRYETVADFRRALLGVGLFVFEQGDEATTPEELAELCARYPEEAADYLYAGEIESWLIEIGKPDLAKSTRQIRVSMKDPEEGVQRFLRAVMGPGAQTRSSTGTRIPVPGASQSGDAGSATIKRSNTTGSGPGWLRRTGPNSSTIVNPRKIDFGEVYPGVSAPLSFTISGNQGANVKGTIHAIEKWINLSTTTFDGMSTRVSVRVDSTTLRGSTTYTGTILVTPEDAEQDIPIKVELEVLGFTTLPSGQKPKSQPSGNIADDEDDPAAVGGMMAQTLEVTYDTKRDSEYKKKYGQPGGLSAGWTPAQPSPRQALWLNRSFIFAGAFLLASLLYILFSNIPFLAATPLNAPHASNSLVHNPWFALILLVIVPAATFGALFVTLEYPVDMDDLWRRASTGVFVTLCTVGIIESTWVGLLQADNPALQLVTLLTFTALAATIGTNLTVSNKIIDWISWFLTRIRTRILTIPLASMVGGLLGYALTIGFNTPVLLVGIVLGIGAAIGSLLVIERWLH